MGVGVVHSGSWIRIMHGSGRSQERRGKGILREACAESLVVFWVPGGRYPSCMLIQSADFVPATGTRPFPLFSVTVPRHARGC